MLELKVKKHRAVKSKHNYNEEGVYVVSDTKMIGNVWEIANVKTIANTLQCSLMNLQKKQKKKKTY